MKFQCGMKFQDIRARFLADDDVTMNRSYLITLVVEPLYMKQMHLMPCPAKRSEAKILILIFYADGLNLAFLLFSKREVKKSRQ